MKVESTEEYKKEENHQKSIIDQSKAQIDSYDKKWEYLSEEEKYSEKGMSLLQEKGKSMDKISESRKEISELEISK